jgi:hypothetical protein
MLVSETARRRARSLSAIAAGLSTAVTLTAWFGLKDGGWLLIIPVIAGIAATIWSTRVVVAIAMLATAAIVVLELDGTGVLFAASVAALMLALNNLQSAATQIRRRF